MKQRESKRSRDDLSLRHESPSTEPTQDESDVQDPTVVDTAPVIGSVSVEDGSSALGVQQYRVRETKQIVVGGRITTVREGSVVDSRSRDIQLLRDQGVLLDEVT